MFCQKTIFLIILTFSLGHVFSQTEHTFSRSYFINDTKTPPVTISGSLITKEKLFAHTIVSSHMEASYIKTTVN